MKRTILSALGAALALGVLATPAQADETTTVPPMRIDSSSVCILPQQAVMGSGWKIQRAATLWNEAQDVVDLRVYGDPSCGSTIIYSRYDSRYPDPNEPFQAQGNCGYTSWQGSALTKGKDGQVWLYDTVHMWINDACLNGTKATRKYFLTHEIGHALGLYEHSYDDATSVMCYCYDYDVLKGHPGAADVARLQALFALDAGVYKTANMRYSGTTDNYNPKDVS